MNQHDTAVITLDTRQKICLSTTVILLIILAYQWPAVSLIMLMIFSQVSYFIANVIHIFLCYIGWRHKLQPEELDIEHLLASDLPSYTILLPLYQEAEVLPALINNIAALIYNPQKLEVLIVLEEDDYATQRALMQLLDAGKVPAYFAYIIVPDSQPRTKGKACNYALQHAKGEFIVIYDAEDRPEPTQLLRAISQFRTASANVVCMQAYLAIDNAEDNWLTTMFALEYRKQFTYLLPAICRLGLFVSLGGTSNHLRTVFLRQIGGWDAFNVTEDADLGVRIAKAGYHTQVLPSTTWEEATNTLSAWFKQRRRWHKGFMQTMCVHSRHPLTASHKMGASNFCFLLYYFGLTMLLPLLTPFMLWASIAQIFQVNNTWLYLFVLLITGANLLLSIGGYIASAYYILRYDQRNVRVKSPWLWSLSYIVYICFHIPATFVALAHLCKNPHYWDKTKHGLRKRRLT